MYLTGEPRRGAGRIGSQSWHPCSRKAPDVSRAHFVLVLFTLTALAGPPAAAVHGVDTGSVRGSVRLPPADDSLPAPSRPRIGDLGGMPAGPVDRRRSVVYLDAVPPQPPAELPPMHVLMDQRNEQFVPRVLAITAGSVVEFPNSDTKFHSVFSLSKPGPFDLGRYAPGRTGARRFDRPGLIRVFCDIHSHMSAFILVFSHPFFAMTGEEGRYRIDDIPPGTYTVVAWNEGTSSDPKPATVPDGGIAELDFTLR